MTPILAVRGLTVGYAGHTVLHDIDLQLDRGETCALVGPNGCGKSTLLRAVCGIVQPSAGDVHIAGHDLQRRRSAALGQVGFVAQRFGLYEDLTVEENLKFYGRCYGLWGGALGRAVAASCERFALTPWRRHKGATLSQGWKQRLAAAAATLHQPSLLLLDEATAGLDAEGRAALWPILAGYAEAGTAILLVTHHDDDAARCQRVKRLHESKLIGAAA
jgi:ABC-2 type transport system ATP-binding protein